MAWTKEKTITMSAQDFLEKDALGHVEFGGKDGKAYLAQIVRDTICDSPRAMIDPLWTWSCKDGAGYSDRGAITLEEIENYGRTERDRIHGIPQQFLKEHLVCPLYLYRHSGGSISLNTEMFMAVDPQGFDHGRMGFACLSRKKIKAEFGWVKLNKRRMEILRRDLEGEVRLMNAWLSDSVYGVKLTELDSEEQDSIWGLYCGERQDLKEAVADFLNGVADDSDAVTEEMMDFWP
jgi:hypothetical protein